MYFNASERVQWEIKGRKQRVGTYGMRQVGGFERQGYCGDVARIREKQGMGRTGRERRSGAEWRGGGVDELNDGVGEGGSGDMDGHGGSVDDGRCGVERGAGRGRRG